MAGALAQFLAPGGEGVSLEEARRSKGRGPTLSSLATICSLAEMFPEKLFRRAPATVARFWNTSDARNLFDSKRVTRAMSLEGISLPIVEPSDLDGGLPFDAHYYFSSIAS